MPRSFHSVAPLLAFNNPLDVWSKQPSFLCAEVLFLLLAAWGIADAARCGTSQPSVTRHEVRHGV